MWISKGWYSVENKMQQNEKLWKVLKIVNLRSRRHQKEKNGIAVSREKKRVLTPTPTPTEKSKKQRDNIKTPLKL